MEIIIDKSKKRKETIAKKPPMKTLSAGIQKKYPTCTLKELLLPEKYEKITLLFYIVFAPILIAHFFLFSYVSKFNVSIYSAVTEKSNVFLNWCMGYEAFAILLFAGLIFFSLRNISLQQR